MNVLKSLFQIISLDMISKLIFGAISICIIRFMPISEFALYAVAIAAMNIISSSVSSIFNRIYIVGDVDSSIPKSSFFTYQAMITILIFFLIYPFKNIFEGHTSIIFFATLTQIFFLFIQTHFQANLNFKFYYISDFLRIAIYLLGFLFLLFDNLLTTRNILIINSLSSLLPFLFFGINMLKLKDLLNLNKVVIFSKSLLTNNKKFLLLYSLVVICFSYTDLIMLKNFSTPYFVAVFGAAFTYYGFLRTILSSVHKLLLPLIEKSSTVDDIKSIMSNFSYISIFALPFFALIIFSSKYFIPFIDNNKYPDSVLIFQILAISSYLSFIFSPYANILFKYRESRFLFRLYFSSFLIYIFIAPFIIHEFSVVGLAILSLITWFLLNFFSYLKSRKLMRSNKIFVSNND